MRYLICLVLVAGCFGSLDANGRPAVIPKLSAMPAEPEKRDAVLDQSTNTTGPENGKGLTKKQRKAVTAAAFAAAFIGSMFSKSANVTFGTAGTIDETGLIKKPRPTQQGPQDGEGSGSSAPPPPPPVIDGTQLVPWIKLDGHRGP